METSNSLFYVQVIHVNIINLTNIIRVVGYNATQTFHFGGFMQQQDQTAPDAVIHDVQVLTARRISGTASRSAYAGCVRQ
jgi:hypothetical protein